MKAFILAALPFIIIGICIALICVNSRKKSRDEDKNCMLEGMCIGMCLGLSLSTALHMNMGLGMLVGEAVGMLVKKK